MRTTFFYPRLSSNTSSSTISLAGTVTNVFFIRLTQRLQLPPFDTARRTIDLHPPRQSGTQNRDIPPPQKTAAERGTEHTPRPCRGNSRQNTKPHKIARWVCPKLAASRNNLCLISQNGSINRLADLRLVSEAVEVLVASRHVLGQVVVESVPGRK